MIKSNDKPLYLTETVSELPANELEIATQLKEHGYVLIKQFFDHSLIDKVVEECAGKYRNDSIYHNENRRIAEAWRISESVSEVACNDRIINLLSTIYGKRAFPFQTLNFEIGTEQRLHSDTIHFNSLPNLFMTGVWVALEDVTPLNGPIRYVNDSHKLPIFNCDAIGIDSSSPKKDPYLNYEKYENFVEGLVEGLSLKSSFAEMKKGDIFVWSANLIHGGSEIKDNSATRLSQVTHYFYEDCVYFTPLTSDLKDGRIHFRLPTDISLKKKVPFFRSLKSMRKEGISTLSIIRSLVYKGLGI